MDDLDLVDGIPLEENLLERLVGEVRLVLLLFVVVDIGVESGGDIGGEDEGEVSEEEDADLVLRDLRLDLV